MIYLGNKTLGVTLLVSAIAIASASTAQDNISIYSPNSDPSNPILIEGSNSKTNFSNVKPLSQEEAESMLKIMDVIEESNRLSSNPDDPLIGLSPDQRAFIESMQQIIPMTPEQIEMFKQRYYQSNIASQKSPLPDSAPVSRSIDLSLDPGEPLPVIRMRAGNVATITFSDRNGDPWPILSVTTGDSSRFSASTAGKEGSSNILVVNPMVEYANSNMVVTLLDHPVPILLTLDSREQKIIDFRVDVRLDDKSPLSVMQIGETYSLPSTGDSTMLAFLDGVPPKGAKKFKTSSRSVEAWVYNDELFIRSRASVLSPAFTAKTSNVSGVNVFKLEQTPVVLMSKDGIVNTVSVSR